MKKFLDITSTIAGLFFGFAVLYGAWRPGTWLVFLIAALLGLVGGLMVATRINKKLQNESVGRITKLVAERKAEVDDYLAEKLDEHGPELQRLMETYRDRIELQGLMRLTEAFEQCERTGQPVKVEFAGFDEVIWVSPPPGVKGDGREVN